MQQDERYNKNQEGVIFDIQRFSVNDGPGIRTIVFIKGCPLKCKWCSNPESQKKEVQIMFNSSNCTKCGKCADICPNGAISFNKKERIDREKCTSCGLCAENCYSNAILKTGKKIKVEDLLEEIRKDSIHFRRSNGGVTLSGGELLSQPEFTAEILKGCRAKGWHTTLETTAYASKEIIEKIIPLADLVLMDIKHTDNDIHSKNIGAGNELILNNAKLINKISRELIIRVPVIPSFNCDKESITNIASFIKNLDSVKRVDLLAYHNLGESKYQNLGMDYEMKEIINSPSENTMEDFKKIVENFGLECTIGG